MSTPKQGTQKVGKTGTKRPKGSEPNSEPPAKKRNENASQMMEVTETDISNVKLESILSEIIRRVAKKNVTEGRPTKRQMMVIKSNFKGQQDVIKQVIESHNWLQVAINQAYECGYTQGKMDAKNEKEDEDEDDDTDQENTTQKDDP